MVYVSKSDSGSEPASPVEPTVRLRDEEMEDGSHLSLWAYLDSLGRLHVDGQDLGPVTKSVSEDGEYEYFKIIAKKDIPLLIKHLGGKPEDDILDLLAKNWTGEKSYEFEKILMEGPIKVELATWSG